MFDSDLNVNDILRTDLMPMYFIEEGSNGNFSVSKSVEAGNGSLDAALSTLGYHR